MKSVIKSLIKRIIISAYPAISKIDNPSYNWNSLLNFQSESSFGYNTKIYPPFHLVKTIVGDYSYVATNSYIVVTQIGKFCSIGPNLICGWGSHPTTGISTHPMFYSTLKQNGLTLSDIDKYEELQKVTIGNDVFIGANVTILNNINIGDGAIIGAGAVVSKDIPPYAIAVGCPIKIIKYRFDEKIIQEMLEIKWWDWPKDKLKEIEKNFFSINPFIKKAKEHQ